MLAFVGVIVGLFTGLFSIFGIHSAPVSPQLPPNIVINPAQQTVQQATNIPVANVTQATVNTPATDSVLSSSCTANGGPYANGTIQLFTTQANGPGVPITDTYTCRDGQWFDAQAPTVPVKLNEYDIPSNGSSVVSVSGMSKYTDSDFGFSIWLPTTFTMTKQTSANMLSAAGYQGGTLSAAWDFSGSVSGRIDEYTSPNRSISVSDAVGMGHIYYYNLYFDTNSHTWMDRNTDDSGYGDTPTPADVSNNTMGGLHIISIPGGLGGVIVPLSARNFLVIHSESRDYLEGIVKTIAATDPSVATPADTATQTQTIQAEYNNYVTAPARCDHLGDVGALTVQNCKQDAVQGQ